MRNNVARLDRGDAPLVEADCRYQRAVIHWVGYEVSAFGELCNRHVIPCNPTGDRARWFSGAESFERRQVMIA